MTPSRESHPDGEVAEFAIKLPGPGLGEVAVADIVDFLRGVVDLVAYAAARELVRPAGLPGRRGAAIEGASRVRLLGLSSGSVTAELAPAPNPVPQGSIDLDVETLSETSLRAVFATVEGQSRDPELANALIVFAERMSARRGGQAVTFIDRRGAHEVTTPIDHDALNRLRTIRDEAQTARASVNRVTGRLYEANVESDEAHVRTASGDTVKVEYDPAIEPEIKRLLGDRTSLIGEVELDPRTNRVREIRARTVDSGIQMEFEGVDFWQDPDLGELAKAVGAGPVSDPSHLHIEASDDEWDELYRVLRSTS